LALRENLNEMSKSLDNIHDIDTVK
jgi:hypothetical protein